MKIVKNTIRSIVKGLAQLTGTTLADVLQEDGLVAGRATRPNRPSAQVVPVFACVNAKANAFAMLQQRLSTADDEIIESGDLVQLADCPSPETTGRKFWKTTNAHLDIFGRAYWHLTKNGNRVLSVITLNPCQMQPKFNQAGELIAWAFYPRKTISNQAVIIPLDEIHEIVDPDYSQPTQPGHGLGPQQVAAQAIAQFFKSDLANEASLDHGVEPGGYFTLGQNISEDQRRHLKRAINEKHQGVTNRRRWMLLEGGMEFKSAEAAFKDMEFSLLKDMSREDICVAFGVPSLVLGYSGKSNLGSGKEFETAERVFWMNTILPRAEWLAEEWDLAIVNPAANDQSLTAAQSLRDATRRSAKRGERILKSYRHATLKARANDRQLFTWFDASSIPAIQKSQLELADQARVWIDNGVPLNQVIAAFDLPFEEQEWGDTWYKPMGLVDVQAEDPLNTEPQPPPPEVAPPEVADTPDPAPPAHPAQPADSENPEKQFDLPGVPGGPGDEIVLKAIPERTRAAMWHAWRRSWMGLEKEMNRKVSRHFMQLRSDMLGKVKSGYATHTKSVIGELLFDLVKANKSLIVKVRPLLRESFVLGGSQAIVEDAAARATSDTPSLFNIADPAAVRAMQKREVAVVGINTTLRKRLRKRLTAAISDGSGQSELIDAIRMEFNMAGQRARTIAMTEIGGAVEESRQIGRKQAKVPAKAWLWSRKETGRRHHFDTEMNTMRKPIPNDRQFTIASTGVKTMQPRGSGRASEDVNCGCSTIGRYPKNKAADLRGLLHLCEKGFLTLDEMRTKNKTAPGTPGTPGTA